MSREKVSSTAVLIGMLLILASFLDPRMSSGAWFGLGIVYFVTSLNFQCMFLEKFILQVGKSLDKSEVKLINSLILFIGLIIVYLLFSILAVCVIVFTTGDIEAKLLFLNHLDSISPFVNFNKATLFGITQESNIQTHPIGILQPLISFLQLALIEVGVFFSIRKILKNLSKSTMLYLFIVLGINVVLMIVGLLAFSLFLAEKSLPDVLTPISFLWLMPFGAIFEVLRLLTEKNRIQYQFIKFVILIVPISIMTYIAFAAQILNLKFFLVFQFIFFFTVSLLLKAHKSTNNYGVLFSKLQVRSYRVLHFGSLYLIVALPITVFLLKINPSASLESTVYFSIVLTLVPILFLLNYGRRLLKAVNKSNRLFDHLWVIDRNRRSSYKFISGRKVILGLSLIVFTYSIFNLFIDLSTQELNRESAKSAQVNQPSTSIDGNVSDPAGVENFPSKNQEGKFPTNSELRDPLILVPDKNWESKIAQGIKLEQAPANIVSNFSSLTKNQAFTSKSCKFLTSEDFQKISNVSFCKSEIPNAPLALFVGNSHASMLQDAVGKSLNELGYSVISIFTSSCTISPKVIPMLDSTPVNKCKNFGEDLSRYISTHKPELIVIAESMNVSVINETGSSVMGLPAVSFLRINIENSIRDFQATTSKIILIDAFPQFPQVSTCMEATGLLNSCVSTTLSTDIYREINLMLQKSTGISLIKTLPWLCYQGQCPAIIEDTLISPDGSHVTREFATLIQPKIKKALKFHIDKFK